MKKITTSLVAFCLPLMAIAADFHTSAPVVAAKLYTQEAEITREARIQINEAGAHRIWVSPLLSTDLSDLSVDLTGAKLISQSTAPILSADNNPIWAEIDQAEAALTLASQALTENEKLADAIIKSGELAENEGDFAHIQSKLAELQTERAKLIASKTERQKALTLLKMRAEWLGIKRDEMAQVIVFDVVAEQAGEVILQLHEPTARASWQPYSEFRLDSQKGQITTRAGAQITQNTGMNWDQVALTLALTPLNYVDRPLLQATNVAVADRVVGRNETTARLTTVEAPIAMMANRDAVAEYASAPPVIESTGLDFTVTLNGKYNLASGSDRHQIPYLQETAAATVYSAVYSWTQPQALLIGQWTQASDGGFIPGETSLYRDGNRLASLYFGEIWTGGAEHILSFGKDPQLDVTFHMPPNYTAGSGFIIKDKIHERRETISVKNLSQQDKSVRIYGRIPVATQQEITVEGKFNPPPNVKDAENVKGIYLWEKTLSPNKTFKVDNGYDIRYPEDKRLIGLD